MDAEILIDRFIRRTSKAGRCVEWCGATNAAGYGRVVRTVNGRETEFLAHRLSYALFVGPTPDDLDVCHGCDNPPCVNPCHLFLGTHTDNMRDAIAKGRFVFPVPPRGEQNGHAKLTEAEVREILALRGVLSQRAIAARFRVSRRLVRRIHDGELWVHLGSGG